MFVAAFADPHQDLSVVTGMLPNFVPDAFSYFIGKRSSNMMASWLLTACHSRTERFHPVNVPGMTKRGSRYLRKMLIQGARSAMPTLAKANTAVGVWLHALLVRTHPNVAVGALAAKVARAVWALLRHGRNYETVPQAAG